MLNSKSAFRFYTLAFALGDLQRRNTRNAITTSVLKGAIIQLGGAEEAEGTACPNRAIGQEGDDQTVAIGQSLLKRRAVEP